MSNGPWWRFNKHGREQKDTIMCFKCQWFQPWMEEEEPQLRRTIDPVEPEGASQVGWCRKKSVPVTNHNAIVRGPGLTDSPGQQFTTDQFMSSAQTLNEVVQFASQEFWCRYWRRTTIPFLWPPLLPQ